MHKLLYLLFVIIVCWSCNQSSETEKYQKKRDNIINVRKKIKEIIIEDVLIGRSNQMNLIDNYLIIGDYGSLDKLVHLFEKKSFNYVTSVAYKGQGPGEIASMGHIGVNKADRIFYVSDHGKQRIFSYVLDSVLTNSNYVPSVKMKMNEELFPNDYEYINDTLCIGLIIEPTGNTGFNQFLSKWDMGTGEIKPMPYTHPDIEKKRINFDVSMKNELYVECYRFHDLMTICSINGDLKYNIYGQEWNKQNINGIRYYSDVEFCGDKIVALYSGKSAFSEDKNTKRKAIFSTKLLVFNLNGDYIQTMETGYQIKKICYDTESNRILMSLDDEIQFAYLDLDEIIE